MPAAFGVKVTFNVTLCPTARVKGKVGPLTENSLPVVWKAERLVFQDRLLVSTTGSVELVPTATWPNDTIEGLAVTASLAHAGTSNLKRKGRVRCIAGEFDRACCPSQRRGSEAYTQVDTLSRKQDQRQAHLGRSEFGVAQRGSRDRHTRLPGVRHGDQQGFGLTDSDGAKSKA